MNNEERYNGWSNRETWAVALHINNDQGWQEGVLEALRATYDEAKGWSLRAAADVIHENVEEVLDGLYAAATDNDNDKARSDYTMIREDIGSLWRVDWTELGAAFLSDLDGYDA